MGHIERRVWSGKASYRARYRDPTGRERSKSFDRKADAERSVSYTHLTLPTIYSV